MKKIKTLFRIELTALMLVAIACSKRDVPDNQGKYGVDGITPLPEAVDLGLSVKWASFNLGASKEHECGDYYAWGETEAYDNSLGLRSWTNYFWCSGSAKRLTKYCTKATYWSVEGKEPDDITTLLPSDDVAHIKLGGKWRMPTAEEINELLALREDSNYNWQQWATIVDEKGYVIHGLRITYKPTGATLYLPAAGDRQEDYNTGLYGGHYWSSSLNADYPDLAWYINFNSVDALKNSYDRCFRFSVRPVLDTDKR